MARLPSALIGPASSTGSPITFMMRPSVPVPTGTVIGPPVSETSWPRTRPSAVSIAMVRTVDSPRCCATSSTTRQQPAEDLVFLRLVFVGGRGTGVGGRGFHHQRNDLLRGRDLRDHGLEARIEQRADVEFAGVETGDHLVGDFLGIDEAELAHRA